MALATYTGLIASIADWLHRADETTVIIDFVTLAHKQLMRDLRGHLRLQVRNASFPVSAEYVPAPYDFMEFVSGYLNNSSKTPLAMVSETSATLTFGITSLTNPQFFSIVSGAGNVEDFHFMPPPTAAQTATIEYYARLPVLSTTVATNWILDDYPELYLYGSLLQAMAYGEDDRVTAWQAAYTQSLQACMNSGRRARSSGPNLQMRPA